MKKEEKELLFKELCAKLPYRIKFKANNEEYIREIHYIKDEDVYIREYRNLPYWIGTIKPYLRPMSSMTQDECTQLSMLLPKSYVVYSEEIRSINEVTKILPEHMEIITDFYNSHHLDWRGLIPKGLALEATENMYKSK